MGSGVPGLLGHPVKNKASVIVLNSLANISAEAGHR
jgi:hypothetical protein